MYFKDRQVVGQLRIVRAAHGIRGDKKGRKRTEPEERMLAVMKEGFQSEPLVSLKEVFQGVQGTVCRGGTRGIRRKNESARATGTGLTGQLESVTGKHHLNT